MIVLISILLIIVGLAVLYLSLNKEKTSKKINFFDWKKTDFAKEFSLIKINHSKLSEVFSKASEYIVGSDNLLKSVLVSILANGHILVEGAPGLAKTKTILIFSKLLGLDFKRIQFTPDMLPSDVIGGEIYDKKTGEFKVFFGPIFTNLLLADEINRATPKVQSALLEAMQERKVTIGNKTYNLPTPFFVMATQNPIEQEGTYPLPEAQMDRFLFKIVVNYPSKEDELKILSVFNKDEGEITPILSKEEILSFQNELKNIFVPDEVKLYIADIIGKLRKPNKYIQLAPSPRASIALLKSSQAIAFLTGSNEVKKEHINAAVLPVLRHRIKLSSYTLVENKSVESIICQILSS